MGKTLSEEQKEDVQRLRKLWDAKRVELGLTQANVAERFGIKNQTAISQYLNGRIPLNMEAAIKFAKVLEVAIHEISPRNGEWIYRPLPMPVKRALDPVFETGHTYASIEMPDASMDPQIQQGDFVFYDPEKRDLLGGGMFVVKLSNAHTVRQITPTRNGAFIHATGQDKEVLLDKDTASLLAVEGKVVLTARNY